MNVYRCMYGCVYAYLHVYTFSWTLLSWFQNVGNQKEETSRPVFRISNWSSDLESVLCKMAQHG